MSFRPRTCLFFIKMHNLKAPIIYSFDALKLTLFQVLIDNKNEQLFNSLFPKVFPSKN